MKRSVTNLNAKNIVDFIGSIFEKRGDEEYLGEPVTMGQHMLQGAAMAEQLSLIHISEPTRPY